MVIFENVKQGRKALFPMRIKNLKSKKRRISMKPKTFNKKLFLNKETIAHLKVEEMSRVPGGIGYTPRCRDTDYLTCPCPFSDWETCRC
jgi:hypothetical protein